MKPFSGIRCVFCFFFFLMLQSIHHLWTHFRDIYKQCVYVCGKMRIHYIISCAVHTCQIVTATTAIILIAKTLKKGNKWDRRCIHKMRVYHRIWIEFKANELYKVVRHWRWHSIIIYEFIYICGKMKVFSIQNFNSKIIEMVFPPKINLNVSRIVVLKL